MTDPDFERRGVANPKIVDLIRKDDETGEVVLVMLEERSWTGTNQQLLQLEDKLNSYFVYVMDGFLAEHYPDYKGNPVRFQLDCVEPPTGVGKEMLEAANDFGASHGIRVTVRKVDPTHIERPEWEANGESDS